MITADVMAYPPDWNGFRFFQVNDTELPFEDKSFDAVLSNYIMEHVGNRKAQLHHLRESRRVVKESGWGYLSVPNRWRLIEPHFKLPLLSWIPQSLRSSYVRLISRGKVYDGFPPSHYELISLFREAKLSYAKQAFDADMDSSDVKPIALKATVAYKNWALYDDEIGPQGAQAYMEVEAAEF